MKKHLPLLLITLFLVPFSAQAESVLTRINKIDTQDAVELYCNFTEIPVYRTTTREKRIDFILEDTVLHSNFQFFKEDDKIVKLLSFHKNNETVLSFFFRYPPQKVEITTREKENKLIVHILLGNPYSAALPEFSSKLSGLTIVERTTKDFSNPLIASTYAADWKSFFRLYESKWQISPPVQFTIPPFPAIQFLTAENEDNKDILNPKAYELAAQNQWHSLTRLLLEQIKLENDPEIKKRLALTYGEALSRDDQFSDAYKQLYLLAEEYNEEPIGVLAKYLLFLLRARFEDPYIADFELRNLRPLMTSANPLTPYFLITQIETALATEQYDRMKELLAQDDVGFPQEIATIKELRQADYWSGTGDTIKAFVGYQLLGEKVVLDDKSYSLNGYCNTLYQQKQFRDATTCYNRLATQAKDKEKLGMINFRKYMSELHYTEPVKMIDFFSRIENTYTDTDAGFSGSLKKTDLSYLYLENWSEQALLHYKDFAQKGTSRSLREEASFKVALVYRLQNEHIQSVKHLMTFLRDFRNGELHQEGLALLIEQFPIVIKQYVDKEMYIEALVLAKQNRKLFVKNWVNIDLLAELATSYNALGVYEEASKIYLYLISLSSEDKKERYYLPVIKAAFDHGAYSIVEDFADRYSFRYPRGSEMIAIREILVQSLLAEQKYSKAINMLPVPIPETESFSLLAANLYFHENAYDKVIEVLSRPLTISDKKQNRRQFMLAESYYQKGQFELAFELFNKIGSESTHYDQTLYRRAEFLKTQHDEVAALKLYKELAETGKSPLWVEMAKKAIEYITVIKN
jgi:tetratricopeptide (TPR) repeat protein